MYHKARKHACSVVTGGERERETHWKEKERVGEGGKKRECITKRKRYILVCMCVIEIVIFLILYVQMILKHI